jgi:hypothetical protein
MTPTCRSGTDARRRSRGRGGRPFGRGRVSSASPAKGVSAGDTLRNGHCRCPRLSESDSVFRSFGTPQAEYRPTTSGRVRRTPDVSGSALAMTPVASQRVGTPHDRLARRRGRDAAASSAVRVEDGVRHSDAFRGPSARRSVDERGRTRRVERGPRAPRTLRERAGSAPPPTPDGRGCGRDDTSEEEDALPARSSPGSPSDALRG